MNTSLFRRLLIFLSLVCLMSIFVFQQMDYLSLLAGERFSIDSPSLAFIINRTVRLILNDTFCIILVANIFQRQEYVRVAGWIFAVELLLLLPAYLWIKLSLEGPTEISSPLLQPIHRMIVNPLLMVILIAAFYYQQWNSKRS